MAEVITRTRACDFCTKPAERFYIGVRTQKSAVTSGYQWRLDLCEECSAQMKTVKEILENFRMLCVDFVNLSKEKT